jgi:large subunit ribosomal protein L9
VDIILLEKVSKVGVLGQRVRVKAGYARNFLIPKGKALPATEANIGRFEARRLELEKAAKVRHESAEKRAAVFEGLSVTISAQSGDEGRLFGSVGTSEIAKALSNVGHDIAKNEIRLLDGPIRTTGEHEVGLQLEGGEITVNIKVLVVAG